MTRWRVFSIRKCHSTDAVLFVRSSITMERMVYNLVAETDNQIKDNNFFFFLTLRNHINSDVFTFPFKKKSYVTALLHNGLHNITSTT